MAAGVLILFCEGRIDKHLRTILICSLLCPRARTPTQFFILYWISQCNLMSLPGPCADDKLTWMREANLVLYFLNHPVYYWSIVVYVTQRCDRGSDKMEVPKFMRLIFDFWWNEVRYLGYGCLNYSKVM